MNISAKSGVFGNFFLIILPSLILFSMLSSRKVPVFLKHLLPKPFASQFAGMPFTNFFSKRIKKMIVLVRKSYKKLGIWRTKQNNM